MSEEPGFPPVPGAPRQPADPAAPEARSPVPTRLAPTSVSVAANVSTHIEARTDRVAQVEQICHNVLACVARVQADQEELRRAVDELRGVLAEVVAQPEVLGRMREVSPPRPAVGPAPPVAPPPPVAPVTAVAPPVAPVAPPPPPPVVPVAPPVAPVVPPPPVAPVPPPVAPAPVPLAAEPAPHEQAPALAEQTHTPAEQTAAPAFAGPAGSLEALLSSEFGAALGEAHTEPATPDVDATAPSLDHLLETEFGSPPPPDVTEPAHSAPSVPVNALDAAAARADRIEIPDRIDIDALLAQEFGAFEAAPPAVPSRPIPAAGVLSGPSLADELDRSARRAFLAQAAHPVEPPRPVEPAGQPAADGALSERNYLAHTRQEALASAQGIGEGRLPWETEEDEEGSSDFFASQEISDDFFARASAMRRSRR